MAMSDREKETPCERLAVRLRETLGAAVREIRPSPYDGVALDVFAGSLTDVAEAAPSQSAGFWRFPAPWSGRRCFCGRAFGGRPGRRCRI